MANKSWFYAISVALSFILLLVLCIAIYINTDWDITSKILVSFASTLMVISSMVANIITIGGKSMFKRSPVISSWDYSFKVAEKLLKDIETSGKKFDVVVGLGRSGGIWGGWIAGNLGSIPFFALDIVYSADVNGDRSIDFPDSIELLKFITKKYKRVLIVEGAVSTGATFLEFKKKHKQFFEDVTFKFATLFKNSTASIVVDYVGETINNKWPDKFAWHTREKYAPHLRQ